MNIKLLKELYKQAETECGWSEEKFAELIVRECVRECKQEWYDTNNDPELNAETDTRMIGIKIGIKQGSLKCISRIKEHFGVEE